jgi:hypothetical protein
MTDYRDDDFESERKPRRRRGAGGDTPAGGSEPPPPDDAGYKRPPKASQWKKGQSGNPGGRRTKPITLAHIVQKIANEKVTVRGSDGRRLEMDQVEVLIRRHWGKAQAGDTASFKLILGLLKQLPWVGRRPMTDRELTRYLRFRLTPAGRRAAAEIRDMLEPYLPRDEDGNIIPSPHEPYFDDEEDEDPYDDDVSHGMLD